jgi:hypothetical protein
MFEYAEGQWKNMYTRDMPTEMRYRAVQVPCWAVVAPPGILLGACWFWWRRKKQREMAAGFEVHPPKKDSDQAVRPAGPD